MQEPTTVDIPIRPHIKAYIENNHFLRSEKQWKHTDPIWPIFNDCLTGKRTRWNYIQLRPGTYVTITLTTNKARSYRMCLNQHQAEKFNNMIERFMMYEFCLTATLLINQTNKKKNQIIDEFLLKYNFSEKEMTHERLRKALYRHQIKLKTLSPRARA